MYALRGCLRRPEEGIGDPGTDRIGELELQTVVSCLTRMLGNELRSSEEHQVIITNEASLQRLLSLCGLYLSIMQMRREGLDMLFYSSYIKSLVPESDFY